MLEACSIPPTASIPFGFYIPGREFPEKTCCYWSVRVPVLGNPDYIAVPSITLFEGLSSERQRRECVDISISNDTLLEDTESFDVLLTSSDGAVQLSQALSRVYIIDDDQVRVGFRQRTAVVSEGDLFFPACVELVGRTQQSIEVLVESRANSADGGLRVCLV